MINNSLKKAVIIMKTPWKKGLTLLELMIALVIIGILTAFAAEYYADTQDSARKTKIKADLEAIKTAIVNYTADEYNIANTRPQRLSELVNAEFRYIEEADTITNMITKRLPVASDTAASIKTKKRHFLEKLPHNPIGPTYYADMYYVYGEMPGSQTSMKDPITGKTFTFPYAVKVPYKNASIDDFATGILTADIYKTLAKGGASVTSTTGSVTLLANNSTSPSDTAVLYTVPIKLPGMSPAGAAPPAGPGPGPSAPGSDPQKMPDSISNTQNKYEFEITFKYSQLFADDPILNNQENRILDPAALSEFKKTNNGCVFFFKNEFPASETLTDNSFKTKAGLGFVFSATQWELYDSPSGTALAAKPFASGGMDENATHQIKFILKPSNTIDCYLDGDYKGNGKIGAPNDSVSASLAMAADIFADASKNANCKMTVYQIKMGCVDFSLYYNAKIR